MYFKKAENRTIIFLKRFLFSLLSFKLNQIVSTNNNLYIVYTRSVSVAKEISIFQDKVLQHRTNFLKFSAIIKKRKCAYNKIVKVEDYPIIIAHSGRNFFNRCLTFKPKWRNIHFSANLWINRYGVEYGHIDVGNYYSE